MLQRARVSLTDEHATAALSAQAAWDVQLFGWLVAEVADLAGILGRANAGAIPYR
jgi:hypothetical protein